jgi:hypothetical protein
LFSLRGASKSSNIADESAYRQLAPHPLCETMSVQFRTKRARLQPLSRKVSMKFSLFTVVIVVLLAGLFHFFEPKSAEKLPPAIDSPPQPAALPSIAAEARPTAVPGASPDASARVVDLTISKGKLVSGPSVVQVKQNEHVVFHIRADTADEVHLHGYNLHLRLVPNELETLDFVATKTGRFTYELHHADIELGALEIYPR